MAFFNLHKNTFRHGIHPPESKDETSGLPIRQFPFAPVIILPMAQHIGAPSEIVVREGQEVQRGQLLAKANGYVSVPMHAPVSGKVRKIANVPTISGKMSTGIYLEAFPFSTQEVLEGKPIDPDTATPNEILQGIQDAGIVGLGGAAFPTHVKLKIPEGKTCDTLIINGVECEPYLTTDHRVMLEQEADIFMGIKYLLKATGAPKAIIGIEANKQDAADHLSKHIPRDLPVSVQVLPVKYPQGAEKMLITSMLGKEIPSGKLPIEVGAVVVNVATTAEIGRLLPHGRGIQERVITITGPGVKKKGNYLIPVGTPLRYVLEQVGVDENISEVYMGGPMMGMAVSNLDISIVKGTSGILVFTKKDVNRSDTVYPCIKCGACVDACPILLNPSKLGILAKFEAYDEMVSDFNLMDCFECGSCTYVCPSHIPLVQYFRQAKRIVRKREAEKKRKPMLKKTLDISTSPHIFKGRSTNQIMKNVVWALLPVVFFSVYAFGINALLVIATATLASVLTEHVLCKLSKKQTTVGDYSAVITGILLGLTLPPSFPLWMAFIGGVIGIALGKYIFGGLGYNVFNPALVARAVLQAAFPVAITTWHPAFLPDRFSTVASSILTLPFMEPKFDAISGATPLSAFKFDGITTSTAELAFGQISGSAGETSAVIIILGGIYLIVRNMMNWRIPVAVLTSAFVLSGILYLINSEVYPSPWFMLFSGGLMLGAVFMATDMVSSPITPIGLWVYGAIIGILTIVIRIWGGLSEGVMYSILLANAISPHIDSVIKNRVYGTQQKMKAA